MAPFTINDAYESFEYQQKQIDKLRADYEKLKCWSDLNDHYIRELIDTLAESVDKILQCVDISETKSEEIPRMIAKIYEDNSIDSTGPGMII